MKKDHCSKGSKGALLLIMALLPTYVFADISIPNKTLLPDEFKVYYNKKVGRLSRAPFKGGKETVIPTNNEYKDAPGCYISCHAKNAQEAAYPISDKIYVMGQVRVEGRYRDGLCLPKGYENKDVRSAKALKEKCEQSFPTKCENNSCWADSHTSNWFN